MPANAMIRAFLVDDHELVRRGITTLLEAEPDIEVVGEASTVRQALTRIVATEPDVAILDVRLPDGSGLEICREISQTLPMVRCLILTGFDDEATLRDAMLAGAAGLVTKSIRAGALIGAVRAAATGRQLFNAAMPRSTVTPPPSTYQRRGPGFESLGLREQQILAHIAEGLTNRQIADQLGLAEKTVKNYVSSLLAKLGLEHRTQAAILLLKHQRLLDASAGIQFTDAAASSSR